MSKSSDARIQPTAVGFNRTGNIDKAAYVLKGIIDGVNVDDNLVDTEILYLDAWMRGQNSLGLQVVAFDLYQAVNRVLEDQDIRHDERVDLNQLIQNILEFGDKNRTPDDASCINEFISILKAICTNGIIFHHEINGVVAWITANKDISKAFPIKPVYHRKHRICDAVTEDFDGSSGQVFCDQVFCDNVEHITFEGKVFCFAGNFLRGTRNQCQLEAELRGARVRASVTADVDVLVIGSITSQDWQHQSVGRSTECAISLHAESGAPTIISEDQWATLLSNSPQPYTAPSLALI